MSLLASYQLLLVEDNPGDADLAREWIASLLDMDIQIEGADSLQKAVDAIGKAAFDGIILDLNPPDSRGMHTLDRLRAISAHVPIIVFAGLSDDVDHASLSSAAGVLNVLNKDESPSALLAQSVRAMLRHANAERRHDQFKSLVTVMPDAVVVTDRAGVVQFLNPAGQSLLGKSRDDLLGELMDFSVQAGQASDLEILTTSGRRSVELRVAECVWDYRPAYLATMRDVTEEKRLAEHLRQTQKMEALGLLAGGVAHDINNLLLVVMLYADLIRKSEKPGLFEEEAGEIVDAVERAQALTRQLLTFSRRHPIERAVLSVPDVVTGIDSMLRRIMPADIEVTTLIEDDVWPVVGDRNQIEQVLMNVAVNARDAMPNGGHFAITLENLSIPERQRAMPVGDYLCMRLSDDGCGIAEPTLSRIFEPFFTTKPRGQGTGLGLATAYAIIAQMGGQLSVDSTVDVGTTFTIMLPRADAAIAGVAQADRQPDALRGSETIMVVDDDQAVGRAARRILEEKGYHIVAAANGAEAKSALLRGDCPVDMVLSDVVMPLMGGAELAEFILRSFPAIPVLFMTGYSDHPITHREGESTIEGFPVLLKPFRPHELLKMIRDVLDGVPR